MCLVSFQKISSKQLNIILIHFLYTSIQICYLFLTGILIKSNHEYRHFFYFTLKNIWKRNRSNFRTLSLILKIKTAFLSKILFIYDFPFIGIVPTRNIFQSKKTTFSRLKIYTFFRDTLHKVSKYTFIYIIKLLKINHPHIFQLDSVLSAETSLLTEIWSSRDFYKNLVTFLNQEQSLHFQTPSQPMFMVVAVGISLQKSRFS